MTKMEAARIKLSELYERDNELTASVVVKEAKKKTSPLHDFFEWDESKAAEAHRLWQARHLIRKCRWIEYKGEKQSVIHVPSIKREEGRYKTGSALVKSIADFDLAMRQAMEKLAVAERSVAELKALVDGEDDDRLTMVLLAVEAMSTAKTALEKIH